MANFYVGVENEFVLYRESKNGNYNVESFPDVFGKLMEKYLEPCFRKGKTCIRTIHGSSIYADEEEAEVCTPPIFVQRGFAIRLREAVFNARHDLAEFIKSDTKLAVVGYSMHHNITARSRSSDITDNNFMRRYATMLSAFALTPLSVGINMRDKPHRRELLADHLPEGEQIEMLHILYAAAQLSPERLDVLISDDAREFDSGYSNLVRDGRTGMLAVIDRRKHREITVQEYLERAYRTLKPTILQLATLSEHEILCKYITGESRLEIDNIDAYEDIEKEDLGIAPTPDTIMPLNKYSRPYPVAPGVPTTLGLLACSDMPTRQEMPYLRTACMEWDSASFVHARPGWTDYKGVVELKSIDDLEIIGRTISAPPTGTLDMYITTGILHNFADMRRKFGNESIYDALCNPQLRNNTRLALEQHGFIRGFENNMERTRTGDVLLQAYKEVMFNKGRAAKKALRKNAADAEATHE